MARIGATNKVRPESSQIMTEETVRKTAIVVHTMGNVKGGGIHEGRLRSAIAAVSLAVVGRELFRGEKTLDLRLIAAKKATTTAFGAQAGTPCVAANMLVAWSRDQRAPLIAAS